MLKRFNFKQSGNQLEGYAAGGPSPHVPDALCMKCPGFAHPAGIIFPCLPGSVLALSVTRKVSRNGIRGCTVRIR